MSIDDILKNFHKAYRVKRRREVEEKHQKGFYMGGQPIVQGRTKAQEKARVKAEHRAEHEKYAEERKKNPYFVSPESKKRFQKTMAQQKKEAHHTALLKKKHNK